jgi:hypothetical protein
MTVIDTLTGIEVATVDIGNTSTAWSLADLYRDVYGVSPPMSSAAGGVAGGSLRETWPFARLVVSVDPTSIIAGQPVTIEARYVDPLSGEPVRKGDGSLRFDPPDSIQATLSTGSGNGDRVTVALAPDGYGVYRATVNVPRDAVWSVEVVATTQGQPNRRAGIDDAIAVQPAITGTDGRNYLLRVSTEPAEPTSGTPVTVMARFVDAETGVPLPEGVDIQGGLPSRIVATFYHGGMTSAILNEAGHGSYRGQADFFEPGDWNVQLSFRTSSLGLVSVDAGAISAR